MGEIEETDKKRVRAYTGILGVTLTLNEIDLSRRSRIEIYFAPREICLTRRALFQIVDTTRFINTR